MYIKLHVIICYKNIFFYFFLNLFLYYIYKINIYKIKMEKNDYISNFDLDNQNVRFRVNNIMNEKILKGFLDNVKDFENDKCL